MWLAFRGVYGYYESFGSCERSVSSKRSQSLQNSQNSQSEKSGDSVMNKLGLHHEVMGTQSQVDKLTVIEEGGQDLKEVRKVIEYFENNGESVSSSTLHSEG